MRTTADTFVKHPWSRLLGALVVLAITLGIGAAAFADNEEAATAGAVIAQGYAFLPEEPFVWRVRSVEPLPADEAEPISPNYSFAYQRAGAMLVRNEATSKRTRLEPGEAYYFQLGDSFTRHRDSAETPETLIVEWVSEENAGSAPSGTILFESDVLDPVTVEVVDYELTRYALHADEEILLPDRDGPAMLFVLDGDVSFDAGGGPIDVAVETGVLVPRGAETMTAGSGGATVLLASVIDHALRATPESSPVAPTEAATEAPTEAPTETAVPPTNTAVPPTATPKPKPTNTPKPTATTGSTLAPAADEDRDGLRNGEEANLGTNPRVKDTDSDGLEDGPEVNLHGTDPLKPDTDGDGITDGQEVNVDKTNPLDKNSKK